MATTSGSNSVAVTSYDTMTISWTLNSQSTANNTSNITFKAVLTSTSSGKISSTASKSYTATINGTEYTGTNTVGISASSSLTLFSKTLDIAHDSDGSKSFTFSFSQTYAITFSGTYIGSKSVSCTVTPTTIARASSITSASAVTLGNACSIKWTPASSSFAYKIKFAMGSTSYTTGYISPASTSAYTYTGYTMSASTWGSCFTSSTTATCTATLYTYSSSSSTSSIGSATATFTVTAAATSLTSASAVTLGNACSVKWTPPSSSYAYKLKFVVGSGSYTTGYISPSTTSAYTYSSYTMTIATWAPYITTSTTATCTVTLYTYATSSSTTSLGTSSKTFTVTVPSSVVPSVSISCSQANSAVTIGVYVQNKSKVKVVSTGTTSYGASITSYAVKVGSSSYTGSSVTSGTITTSGSVTVSCTVTDARGRTGTASTTITVYAYSSPTISAFTALRCTSDGTTDASGEYIQVAYDYSVSSCNSKNSANMTVKWKLSSASSYGTTIASSTSYSSSSSVTPTTTFSTDSSYNVQISVTDAFTTTTKTVTVSTAIYPLSIYYDGTGVAIGKVAESSELLDVAWNTRVRGSEVCCGSSGSSIDQSMRVTNSLVDGHLYANTSGQMGVYNITLGTNLVSQNAAGTVRLGNSDYPTTISGTAATAEGDLTVKGTRLYCGTTDSAETQQVRVVNSEGTCTLYTNSDGNMGLWNSTLNTCIVGQTSTGTLTLGSSDYPTKILGSTVTVNGYSFPKILTGTVQITAAASSITEQAVTFSTAFSSTPQIFLSIYSTTTNAYYGYLTLMFANHSTTGFTLRVANAYTSDFNPSIRWMAVLV